MKKFWDLTHQMLSMGQLGIVLDEHGFALAQLAPNQQLNLIEYIDAFPQQFPALLKEQVQKFNLEGTQTIVLLPEKDYQIFLIEQPPVPENEKSEAIRLKIVEYIDFPLEEAIVDYIELPSKESLGVMLYVIVSKKEKVEEIRSWIIEAGLSLKCIDIRQSALRKIASLLEEPEEGQVLLHLEDKKSYVLIFKNKMMYFMRDIDIGLESLPEQCHDLALEIHRSIDYCSSHIKNISISRLVLTPLLNKSPNLLSSLSNVLGLPVREMNYIEILGDQEEFKNEKINCWVVGAALSESL